MRNGSAWFEDAAGKRIAATVPSDVVAAAQVRGRSMDLWDRQPACSKIYHGILSA